MRRGITLLIPLLLLSACGWPAWRDQVMRDLMEGRIQVDSARIGTGVQPSQTIEFYDRAGRHVGYGAMRGGSVDLYNVDGSRAGYGRAK